MMSNAPNIQQATALAARGSVVLSSGAGCGKTYVLTRRYLAYLSEHSISQIVAITFTERAAREMRQRIRKALTEQIQQEPDAGWQKHLEELESASITTIHSFCGNLIRQHAVLLGIDPQFEILEGMLSVNLRDDAIRESMYRLLVSKDSLGEDCRSLTVIYGWSTLLNCIDDLLNQTDLSAWNKWCSQTREQVLTGWKAIYDQISHAEVIRFLRSDPSAVEVMQLLNSHHSSNPKVTAKMDVVRSTVAAIGESKQVLQDLETIRDSAVIHHEKAKAWESEEIYRTVLNALKRFRDGIDKLLESFTPNDEWAKSTADIALQFLRVALKVSEDFQETKYRLGVLDFEDLLALASQLLRDHPEIRRQVRDRFPKLLLDEMQDTDPVQMSVIRFLTEDLQSESRLFAVGDVKQSIYRFRGAEVELFTKLRYSVPEENRLPLTMNYRSQPDILNFVNALFESSFTDYEALTTQSAQVNPDPIVECWWNFGEEEKLPVDELRHLEAKTIARRIHDFLVSQKAIVRCEETKSLRPLKLGDVVFLFRSMSQVPIYEAALRDEGLNYYIVGGRAFFAQQEVYDVLNLLKTLENPDDSISLFGTLRSPFGGLSDETLMSLGMHADGLWESLNLPKRWNSLSTEQQERTKRVSGWLNTWRSIKDRVPMTQLLNQIIRDSGYDAALQLEGLGERKLANLWKLIDIARTFDRTGIFHLADFIRQLSAMVTRELKEEQAATQPENADVIRLMSVHQSKGLEFPVVILPDIAGKKMLGLRGLVHWDAELGCVPKSPDEDPPLLNNFVHRLLARKEAIAEEQEELRIFYVATTRAKDFLVLSASFREFFPNDAEDDQPLEIADTNPWISVLNHQFDLRSGKLFSGLIEKHSAVRVSVRLNSGVDFRTDQSADETPVPLIVDRRTLDSSPNQLRSIILFDAEFPDQHVTKRSEILKSWLEKGQVEQDQFLKSVDWYQSELVVQRMINKRVITIRSIIDGRFVEGSEQGVAVIDSTERGLIRLGLVVLCKPTSAHLIVVDPESATFEIVSAAIAKKAAETWIKTTIA